MLLMQHVLSVMILEIGDVMIIRRQSQFAGDDGMWSCPSCFAGQEQGYSALDASTQSPPSAKTKKPNGNSDLDLLNEE